MPNKIAFVGVAGSGKDYFADYLINEHQYTRIAFADALKEFVHTTFPYIKLDYPPIEKEQPLNIYVDGQLLSKTPREIWLQTSSMIRDVSPLFFFNKTIEKLEQTENDIIVTDVRSSYEYNYLVEHGYTIIYIEPTKQIYGLNDFDKQINQFKDKITLNFINNFNGLDDFIQFYNKIKGQNE